MMQGLVFEEVFAALGALQLDTGEVARLRGINREHECLLVARDRGRQTLDFDTGRGRAIDQRLGRSLWGLRPRDWHRSRNG